MSSTDSFSASARRYLAELESALSAAPAALRADILTDIADELTGLDEDASRARIAELGDPRVIAADAAAEAQAPGRAVPVSRAYPTAAAIVLTAGWYFVPIVGWIAGLVMIGMGKLWTPQVRVASAVVSVAAALVALAALLIWRGTDLWLLGLTVFLLVPLIANIFVGGYLRRQWGVPATA
ncbi:hypothetical protein RCH12_003287 [Cryobacterium sp. MP_3.1]|uniref:DUF1700 domain-containing protein n=1 Tax=Cryobacterium zongtaii TaxID=1259217 RepID=A0A2S3ZGC4_9MICO|nr:MULTISPECIES: hypothetical protein [Cryobacterium]MEC5185810.1 hypothetical protein [Cryobacterium sp. MP_3.1]POH66393.1 hypothetical protein C3B59_08160 [Cryobacterium zongtaii]